jgi:phage-related protein
MNKKREVYFFKDYFEKFFAQQTAKVQRKILWTLKIIEEIYPVPDVYLKHLKGTSGLYEIRVQVGSNIFRIFCFFDIDNLVVIGHGFQKKSQKIPKQQIERAEQIKKEYYETKHD